MLNLAWSSLRLRSMVVAGVKRCERARQSTRRRAAGGKEDAWASSGNAIQPSLAGYVDPLAKVAQAVFEESQNKAAKSAARSIV